MQIRQDVLPARERFQHGAMIEAMREVEPPPVACVGIEVGQYLVHASELGVEHLLKLSVVQFGENPLGPGGELDLYFQRGSVGGIAVGVAQPGECLVQYIPWRPETVQVE